MVLEHEREFWVAKARVNWLLDWVRNTRFFHTTTIEKRRRNKILALKNDSGDWVFEHDRLMEMISDHFNQLYSTEMRFVS